MSECTHVPRDTRQVLLCTTCSEISPILSLFRFDYSELFIANSASLKSIALPGASTIRQGSSPVQLNLLQELFYHAMVHGALLYLDTVFEFSLSLLGIDRRLMLIDADKC